MVSRELRTNFTFSCFRVDTAAEGVALERGLIALLAQYPLASPSPTWLGHSALSDKIRNSGLWNTQRVDATPLTEQELQRLERLT